LRLRRIGPTSDKRHAPNETVHWGKTTSNSG
jgi:hypothetical protein